MGQVLYRTYRPQKFDEVIGQQHVVTTLSNQIKNNKISHAYLFTGPRGVGKTSIARILARAASCEARKEGHHEPDNKCVVCQSMLNGQSLDFVEIDAASHTGVDNIREIIEHLTVPPTKSKYRTFIIDEVHMLSRGAFNALLKTLEEPPAHALFILATTELHKVPETVLSRTQRFDFRKFTTDQIEDHLKTVAKAEKLKIDDEITKAIAHSVDGGMRDALVMLEKASHLAKDHKDTDELQRLLGITPVRFRNELLSLIEKGDLPGIASFFNNLTTEGYNLEQFNREFLEMLRERLAEDMNVKRAKIAEAFVKAHGQMRTSPIAELPLMVAAISVIEGGDEKKNSPDQNEVRYVKPSGKIENVEDRRPVTNKSQVSNVGLAEVQDKWMEVLTRVRHYNQSLLAALKLAEPVECNGHGLVIAFPYKFHADTVNAAKNRLVIERVLEEVFSSRVSVRCISQKENGRSSSDSSSVVSQAEHHEVPLPEPPQEGKAGAKNENSLIKSALDILGGEVI